MSSSLEYKLVKESVNEARLDPKQLLQQLGGNKFKMMTGAKNFGIDGKSLTFSIGRNSKGINFVRIKLTSMDLYDIQFAQLRMGQVKVKSTAKRVYGDQLGKVFKKHTGMNVRLFGETINEAPKNYDRAMKKMLDFMKKSAYKQYDKRFPFHIESNTWQYPKLLKKGRTFDKLVTVRNNAPNKAQSADFFVHRETGDISIDDQSIYQVNLFSLRENISLVSQDISLFDDTIKNNIAYADSFATQKDIEEACKRIPSGIGIQGNVDPGILFGNKESIKKRIDNTFNKIKDRKYILNLGHGILPGTPEENAQTFFEHGKKLTY